MLALAVTPGLTYQRQVWQYTLTRTKDSRFWCMRPASYHPHFRPGHLKPGAFGNYLLACHPTGVTQRTTAAGPRAKYGCAGTDPREAASVRAGWILVDAHERLGARKARQAFRPWLDASVERAKATLADLRPWKEGLTTFKIHESDTNRLRHRRILDLVLEGETVFDVGTGRGYMCGLLLRERAVAAYHGIDLVSWYRKQVAKVLEANNLPSENVHVQEGDLYELQRETIEASGATVVTCSEVLEHVPDAAKALRALADALPPNADLVFSVPMYGRIENVWGHCSTFDSTRLKLLCEGARLYVHHVEPVANTWTLVVASRRPDPSDRVLNALAASFEPSPSVPLADMYEFVPVNYADMTPYARAFTRRCKVSPAERGDVRCEVARDRLATLWPSAQLVGVTFPVRGLTALRIRLGLPCDAPVSEVIVAAYAQSLQVGQWLWRPQSSQLSVREARRWAFRFGEAAPPFEYSGLPAKPQDVDRVEIIVRRKYGRSLSFTAGAAYIPAPLSPQRITHRSD